MTRLSAGQLVAALYGSPVVLLAIWWVIDTVRFRRRWGVWP